MRTITAFHGNNTKRITCAYVWVYLYTKFGILMFCGAFLSVCQCLELLKSTTHTHTPATEIQIVVCPKWYPLYKKALSGIICPGVKSFKMPDLLEVLKIDITVDGIMFAGDSKKLWIAATWQWLSGIICWVSRTVPKTTNSKYRKLKLSPEIINSSMPWNACDENHHVVVISLLHRCQLDYHAAIAVTLRVCG